MIRLDTESLNYNALHIDGCYSVDVSNNIKAVKINGETNTHVIYCDVNKGFAIVYKKDISGRLTIVNGDEFVYNMVFGDIEVEFK